MLEIDIVTLFPDFFDSPLKQSLLKRAQKDGLIKVRVHNLRDWAKDKHQTVDDSPFGGGPGMVFKIEPMHACLNEVGVGSWKILMDAHGEPLSPELAKGLAGKKKIVLIAGHYEGMDYRIKENLVDQMISVGDFITMGGEAPALCLIEALTRFVPGVLGNEESLEAESFGGGLLEYPQYTRPREYNGWEVPEILFSGNHSEIKKWRDAVAMELTRKHRPDLLEKIEKPAAGKKFLKRTDKKTNKENEK
ncbi:MAG TPA: tRNA (guanosine(37)-N1)-methyltransferase TrmD [Candidatus Omnitrophota bacterium]|nr:tRNA (guanosine(37)-N1)-methyltransferase TrmD [Candidatus Omnitrophota bacterium]